MRLFRFLMIAALLAAFTVPSYADEARTAYKRGVQAERYNKYDEAFEAFRQAEQLKPRDAEYLAAFTRMKFYAAAEHVRLGQNLREGCGHRPDQHHGAAGNPADDGAAEEAGKEG